MAQAETVRATDLAKTRMTESTPTERESSYFKTLFSRILFNPNTQSSRGLDGVLKQEEEKHHVPFGGFSSPYCAGTLSCLHYLK